MLEITGVEKTFDEERLIVSKTDCKGIIQYVNDVFVDISGYTESELLGQPHRILRHPRMPRCVFKLLWDRIQDGQEVFAYVLNRTKQGNEYWVFAHVTPSFGRRGDIVGYHSNRRAAYRDALPKVKALYDRLLAVEAKETRSAEAARLGFQQLEHLLAEQGCTYDEFVFSLSKHTQLEHALQ